MPPRRGIETLGVSLSAGSSGDRDRVVPGFMGFLEEAIREHLELQRRRGADPRSSSALSRRPSQPLVPGQTPAWAQGPLVFDHRRPQLEGPSDATDPVGLPPDGTLPPAVASPMPEAHAGDARFYEAPLPGTLPAERAGANADLALLEQETAEFDMSTVLGEAPLVGPRPPGCGRSRVRARPCRRIVPSARRVSLRRASSSGRFQLATPRRRHHDLRQARQLRLRVRRTRRSGAAHAELSRRARLLGAPARPSPTLPPESVIRAAPAFAIVSRFTPAARRFIPLPDAR